MSYSIHGPVLAWATLCSTLELTILDKYAWNFSQYTSFHDITIQGVFLGLLDKQRNELSH